MHNVTGGIEKNIFYHHLAPMSPIGSLLSWCFYQIVVVAHRNSSFLAFLKVCKYGLLTKREVKMAGYWPSSFFAFLWTETKSRSIKTQK